MYQIPSGLQLIFKDLYNMMNRVNVFKNLMIITPFAACLSIEMVLPHAYYDG